MVILTRCDACRKRRSELSGRDEGQSHDDRLRVGVGVRVRSSTAESLRSAEPHTEGLSALFSQSGSIRARDLTEEDTLQKQHQLSTW